MDSLLSKGYQSAAAFLREEYTSGRGKRKLKAFLRSLLDPENLFDEDRADLCLLLLSGGKSPDDYFKILKTYDNSPVCGLVWNANFFAYRCRDCGISPCMSLCADCFLAGNHDGHDFNMFKSQAGGACDCGDDTVMRKEGFCHLHGENSGSERCDVPQELIGLPREILPRLVTCLYEKINLQTDFDKEANNLPSYLVKVESLLKVLNRVCEVEVLREIVCAKILCSIDSLVNTSHIHEASMEVETNLVSYEASNGMKIVRTVSTETAASIEMTVSNAGSFMPCPHKPLESEQVGSSMKEGSKETYLQFFMDILVKTEFPSILATFLLQLLPNSSYKETFTRLFCRQYTAIGKSLSLSTDPDVLSNHMVHVSVQLFSNETLALKMVKEENLLFKMIFVLSKMIGECLDNYSLEVEGHESSIMAINCNNKLLKLHCYWPIASDLTNILSHRSVARIFLETGDCLNRWMHFVTMLTGMNMNNRRMMSYVEYESKQYYTAFSMEFESVAAVMWEIYRAIGKMDEKVHALKMIEVSAAALKDWYSYVPTKLKKSSFTFHLSLHRYFALFVSQAVNHFEVDLKQIVPTNIVWCTLEYLVNAIVSLQEIRGGFWLYNGHQMTCQAQSYLQSYFCNSMFDLDLFFLQIAVSLIDADTFLYLLMDRFCIQQWFQFGEETKESKSGDDTDKTVLLVEGFLNMILMLLTHRVYSGGTEKAILQKDIIASLCLADRTHSQLVEIIPTRPGDTHTPGKYFDQILSEIAVYKSPAVESSGLQQGIYTPKDFVWEKHFDYNHIQLRVYKKSDHQAALERYNAAMQRSGYTVSSSSWPPLHDLEEINPMFKSLYRLLQSKTLHKILIFILHKIVNDFNSIPEPVIISTIHLMKLSLDHADLKIEPGLLKKTSTEDIVIDLVLEYLSAEEGRQLQITAKIKEEVAKDDEIRSKVAAYPADEDITYLVEGIFHNAIFKSLCEYMDTILNQDSISLRYTIQHLRSLVLLLSDKKYKLLWKLIQHWSTDCKKNGTKISYLPFVAKQSNAKSFGLVLSLLVKHFDYLFQVHSEAPGYPADAFCIDLPDSSIRENIFAAINSDDISNTVNIDRFVEVAQCSRADAAKHILESRGDLQGAITKYFNEVVINDSSNQPTSISLMNTVYPCSSYDNPVATSSSTDIPTTSRRNSVFPNPYNITENCSTIVMLVTLRDLLIKRSSCSPINTSKKQSKLIAGDGSFHIDRILAKCASYSERNATIIEKFCPDVLHQNKDAMFVDVSNSLELKEKAKKERRRKAAERQKQLLAEFVSQQKKFLESAEGTSMDIWEESNQSDSICKKCVICGLFTESTEERPIGLIVFMHSSTICAKQKVLSESSCSTSSSGPDVLCRDLIAARRKALLELFDSRSVRSAFECGVDCGINIQSCGHHVHVDCHQSYFKTIQEEHLGIINTDKGEFSCPLCRQLSNGIMPLLPTTVQTVGQQEFKENQTFKQKCTEIATFLSHYQQGGLSPFTARALEFTVLTASMSTLTSLMEEILKLCNKEMVDFYIGEKWRWSDSFFTLLASFRHNLEMEFMNSSSEICSAPVKGCINELMEAFHFHCQSLSSLMRYRWYELCYGEEEKCCLILILQNRFWMYFDVPLLLCDPISLLLQFFLSWPHKISQAELKIVIQSIFNLVYVQSLIAIGSRLQTEEKKSWYLNAEKGKNPPSLTTLASVVWMNSTMFESDCEMKEHIEITQNVVSLHTVECQMQQLCLPFMKFAALLSTLCINKRYMRKDMSGDFPSLVSYLQLGGDDIEYTSEITSTECLQWTSADPCDIIYCWCSMMKKGLKNPSKLSKDLLPVSKLWLPPKLVELPKLFDSLFQKYRKRKCVRCQKMPDDPTICLVCGDFLCFHGACCRQDSVNECVQHSIDCGCGTGVFLVISSSVTLIIRDDRVCLWGSVYLDSFGEEDRDLRRGKPLYLSEERYQRLEEDWRNHMLDKTCKRWGVHLNRL